MEINNISLALWDQRPMLDHSDGYSKYMDRVEAGNNKKQQDVGRYRIDMIIHDKLKVKNTLAGKLLWPVSRHRSGNQYKLHKDWFELQFSYASELKNAAANGGFDLIHPPLVAIPYRPGTQGNDRRVTEEPSVIIALRMRPAGDTWDQRTIHHWIILWRVKVGDETKTLQFKIIDAAVEEGRNNTYCRRTKYDFCPIDLPRGLFRYGMREGTDIRDENEVNFLNEYALHTQAERDQSQNYASKFAKQHKVENIREKNMIIECLEGFLNNDLILDDIEMKALMDACEKYKVDAYKYIAARETQKLEFDYDDI